MKPSTEAASPSTCSISIRGDSSALTSTSVCRAALARCSAPRISSKKCGFVMSASTIAMVRCRPAGSGPVRAVGLYPSSLAAVRIRCRVASLTRPGTLNALETVDGATPARSATS